MTGTTGRWDEVGQAALGAVERALSSRPDQADAPLAEAERQIASLRDRLIEALRAEASATDQRSLQSALDRANRALSLVLANAYPLAARPTELLGQARDDLQAALAILSEKGHRDLRDAT